MTLIMSSIKISKLYLTIFSIFKGGMQGPLVSYWDMLIHFNGLTFYTDTFYPEYR